MVLFYFEVVKHGLPPFQPVINYLFPPQWHYFFCGWLATCPLFINFQVFSNLILFTGKKYLEVHIGSCFYTILIRSCGWRHVSLASNYHGTFWLSIFRRCILSFYPFSSGLSFQAPKGEMLSAFYVSVVINTSYVWYDPRIDFRAY